MAKPGGKSEGREARITRPNVPPPHVPLTLP